MTPATRLSAALDLLGDVARDARPADAVVSAWLRTRRGMDDSDRGAILETLNGVLRHHARLGWWLDRQGGSDTPRGRLLAWLALVEGHSPDQIRRLFSGAKDARPALTDDETALLTALQGSTILHPDVPEEVRLECPDWAAGPLRHRFKEQFAAEMAALLTPPPLDLRVNTIRSTRDAMLRRLQDLGLPAEAAALAPHGIRIRERLSLARLAPLKTGEVEIQDEGSQLVALLVDARPGERVVDFCAGAGGKTLAIATQMNNKGHIAACDVSEGRLKRCAERLRKAGLHNVQTQLLTSETDRWVKRRKRSFDRVLIDAPCSGTGTWRRNPDARWRAHRQEGLDQLVALQSRILTSAARLVKPGGRLVYATCSMLSEENEAQVVAFLAAHPDFRVVPIRDVAPQLAGQTDDGFLSLTPARHDTDGFFAAVMQRAAESVPPPESA
ncbi:MAG: RsmB/NOP family class I SAM-dependent RNA methyltransferase [Alphaproteobacteria bacterium]|nr:RsmB/NOP family class I SAM-dependent RNA methyltransferase [Alphaproteobacteria bacterium]